MLDCISDVYLCIGVVLCGSIVAMSGLCYAENEVSCISPGVPS